MNKDLRVLKASNLPSDDSGSDGEENLRVARSLKTQQQHLDGVTVFWPSFCKVHKSFCKVSLLILGAIILSILQNVPLLLLFLPATILTSGILPCLLHCHVMTFLTY